MIISADQAHSSPITLGSNLNGYALQEIGKTGIQADALVYGAIDPQTPAEDVISVFNGAAYRLGLHVKRQSPIYEGCVTTASMTHVSCTGGVIALNTLNLGDSRASLVLYNPAKQQVTIKPLTVDHDINNPAERKRILKAGGRIEIPEGKEHEYLIQERVPEPPSLVQGSKTRHSRITRALADTWFDHVSDMPEQSTLTVRAAKGLRWPSNNLLRVKPCIKLFLMVETDGLHISQDPAARKSLLENWLSNTAKNRTLTPKTLLEISQHFSRAVGCRDDLSGLAIDLPLDKGDYGAVFMACDGAGLRGEQISRFFAQDFDRSIPSLQ